GQFECGALRCQERRDLHSYELNFKYKEAGEIKNELVKVRVCPQCARKLFRKKIEALQRQRQAEARRAEAEEAADRERRRKRGEKHSPLGSTSSISPSHGSTRGGQPDAGGGHDFVLQAMGGLNGVTGKGGDGQAVARKRSRPSRWGDRVEPPQQTFVAQAVAA
ncbi:unnamed protein product, partial [Scytosiphon promiscuus]